MSAAQRSSPRPCRTWVPACCCAERQGAHLCGRRRSCSRCMAWEDVVNLGIFVVHVNMKGWQGKPSVFGRFLEVWWWIYLASEKVRGIKLTNVLGPPCPMWNSCSWFQLPRALLRGFVLSVAWHHRTSVLPSIDAARRGSSAWTMRPQRYWKKQGWRPGPVERLHQSESKYKSS